MTHLALQAQYRNMTDDRDDGQTEGQLGVGPVRYMTTSVHRADHFGTKLLRYMSMTNSVHTGVQLRYMIFTYYVPFR